MQIEVLCPACGARYRVPADFVGRQVVCKKCSSRFVVEASNELPDELLPDAAEDAGAAASSASSSPDDTRTGEPVDPRQAAVIAALRRGVDVSGDDDDDDRPGSRRRGRRRKNDRPPLLPPEVSEGILPLVLTVVTLGLSLWLLIKHALASANPVIALVFLGLGIAGYMLLTVPLAQRAVQSAADTSDFSLPNGVWLQTFSLLGIPTLLATVGYFNSGVSGAVWLGALGMLVMSGLMMLVFGAPPLGAVLAGLLTSTFYALGAAVTFGALAGISYLMIHNNAIMPWENVQVASATSTTQAPPPPVTKSNAVTPPPPSSPLVDASHSASTPLKNMPSPPGGSDAVPSPSSPGAANPAAPQSADAVATAKESKLFPMPDGLAGGTAPGAANASPTPTEWSVTPDAQATPLKWSSQTRQTIEVRPPMRVVHSDPPGPIVAVIDRDALDVFDVRTGRRAGHVKQDFNGAQLVLHPAGTYIASVRWMPVGADGVSAPAVGAPVGPRGAGNYVLEVFPVANTDVKPVVRVVAPAPPAPLGYTRQSRAGNFWFAGDNGFVTAFEDGSTTSVPAPAPAPGTGRPTVRGPVLTVRDLKLGAAPRAFPATDLGPDCVVSPGGKYLASLKASRLSVYDLNAGSLAGQTAVAAPWQVVRAFAFSPAGDELAAVLDSATPPWRLVVWDVATGAAAHDVPLAGAYSTADWSGAEFHWLVDGSGVVVGNDLVDLDTGRTFYAIPAQTAGQLPGKVLRVLWPDQVAVEFLPAANGTRLLYNGVPLPRRDIDGQLKALREGAVAAAPAPPGAPGAADPAGAGTNALAAAPQADLATPAIGTSPSASTPGAASPGAASPGVASPAPSPADPPPTALTAATISPQLSAILKQIDGGKASDALPLLLDMSKGFPKSLRSLTDEQVVALHALGVCYMKLGDAGKARDPIDRASNSGRSSRALLVNRAKLDLQTAGFVVRGIQLLDKAMTQYGVDEDTLNLMGHGLKLASSRASTASEVRRLVDKYMAYEKQLESTRPGMKRWGSQWLTAVQYDMTARPAVLVAEERDARLELDEALREQKLAQSTYDEARRAAFMNQQDYLLRRRLDNAGSSLRSASDSVGRAQSKLNEVQARFPKPDWTPSFEPLPVDTQLRAEGK